MSTSNPFGRFAREARLYRRRILLGFAGTRTAIAATLICCLTCTLFVARPAHALDPNKRLTQYLHTSWRIQDGSAPAGMFTVAQTSDGFLWFSTYSRRSTDSMESGFFPGTFRTRAAPATKY